MTSSSRVTNPARLLLALHRVGRKGWTMPHSTTDARRAYMAEYFQRTRLVRLEKLRNRTPEERAILNEHKRQLWLAADQETRDHVHRQSAQWRKDHPEEYRAAQRRYSTSPKGRAAKRRSLLERFNLTQEQYDAMLADQGGVCAICRQPETHKHRGRGTIVSLSIDHDHRCCPGVGSCGKCVRGLLCDRCNVCRFPDDPAILRAAADYFEKGSRA